MTVLTEHAVTHVNALGIGVTPGEGLSATDRSNNSHRINAYLSGGFSVYFPPGHYEISAELLVVGHDNVKIWGDDATLKQVTAAARAIHCVDVTNLEISGLTVRTSYYDRQALSTVSWGAETPIFVENCNQVRIHDNLVEGFEGGGIVCRGGEQITIVDNQCRNSAWNPTDPGGGDIFLTAGDQNPSRVIINNNQCNGNSLFGIGMTYISRHLTCSDNIVVTQNAAGDELNSYSTSLRKSCIELQYHTDLTEGGTGDDESQWEHIVCNNICQGCRYGGISYQSSKRSNFNEMGLRGTVNGNVVRYVALEADAGAEDFVINGIFVDQFRDITIADNIVLDVGGRSGAGGWDRAGIAIGPNQPRSANPPSWALEGKQHSLATIRGNIIKRCLGDGIRIAGSGGDSIVDGNFIYEAQGYSIRHHNETIDLDRYGMVTFTNNRVIRLTKLPGPMCQFSGSTGRKIIADNYLEATGTFTSFAPLVQVSGVDASITGNRFKGVPDANFYCRGLSIVPSTSERYDKLAIADNVFETCALGMYMNMTPAAGPAIISNNTFSGCGRNVSGPQANNPFYGGQWSYPGYDSDANCRATVYYDQVPNSGNWLVGDICWNIAATSGKPMGWICTAAGNPGSWTPLGIVP